MRRFAANVALSTAILVVALYAAHHMRYAWAEAFITDRTFGVYLGILSGVTALRFVFEVLFFAAVGIALAAATTTGKPTRWVIACTTLYSLFQYSLLTHYGPIHAAWVYVDIAVDLAGPIVGGAVGAWVSTWVRRMAPNNSSKPTPLRGAA